MEMVKTLKELRQALHIGERSGLVPTMGALHDGHLSLVTHAKTHASRVAATIFVNPTQFAPGEDLDSYPRTLDDDLAKLKRVGCDVVFVPDVATMYPEGDATTVTVGGSLTDVLEGTHRPHFFGGVATVVAKLLNAARADVAVFGEKDFQQLQVIRRLAEDLLIGTEIIGAPTVRAEDGLALSSRNAYLDGTERQIAPSLYQALQAARIAIEEGDSPAAAMDGAVKHITEAGFGTVDYIAYRDAKTLQPVDKALPTGQGRLLAAAFLGKTRLIDNIAV